MVKGKKNKKTQLKNKKNKLKKAIAKAWKQKLNLKPAQLVELTF